MKFSVRAFISSPKKHLKKILNKKNIRVYLDELSFYPTNTCENLKFQLKLKRLEKRL